jgi:hypothetical protein
LRLLRKRRRNGRVAFSNVLFPKGVCHKAKISDEIMTNATQPNATARFDATGMNNRDAKN